MKLDRKPLHSLASNSFSIYLKSFINIFLRFFYVIFIAKILGPELYGLLAYGQSWYLAILPFCGLGLGALLAISISKHDRESIIIAELVLAARIIAVTFLAILSVVLALVLENNPETILLLCLFSAALLGKGASMWATNMFNAFEMSKIDTKLEGLFRPLELILGIGLAFLTKDIFIVAANHVIFMWLQGYVSVRMVQTNLRSTKPRWEFQEIKGIVKRMLPMAISTPFSQLFLQGPVLLLKYVGAPIALLGNLSLSMQAFTILNGVFTSIGLAAMPVLSRIQIPGDNSNSAKYAHYAVKLSVFAGVLIFLMGAIFIEPVVRFIFPTGYENTAMYTQLLLLALIPAISKALLRSVLVSSKRFKGVMCTDIFGILSLALAFPFLYEHYGFQGAFYAIITGYSVAALITMALLVKSAELRFLRDISTPFVILLPTFIFYSFILSELPAYSQSILTLVFFITLVLLLRYLKISEIKQVLRWVKS